MCKCDERKFDSKPHRIELEIEILLISNIDETGYGKVLKQGKKRVISFSDCPTVYCECCKPGYITMVLVLWGNGQTSKILLMQQAKSIERELLPFGLPDGEEVRVVASASGFITEELFTLYITSRNHLIVCFLQF